MDNKLNCAVCDGVVEVPSDVILGELLGCEECGSELEVTQLEPAVQLSEAPMCAEDWGE